jgi:hypothetical protein
MTPPPESDRLPAWPDIRELLEAGTPQAIAAEGTPAVQLIVDGESGRLGRTPFFGPPTVRVGWM